MTPKYIAFVPCHYYSEHKSEQAAIRAVRKAERKLGLTARFGASLKQGRFSLQRRSTAFLT